jgi:hypothetical protein
MKKTKQGVYLRIGAITASQHDVLQILRAVTKKMPLPASNLPLSGQFL